MYPFSSQIFTYGNSSPDFCFCKTGFLVMFYLIENNYFILFFVEKKKKKNIFNFGFLSSKLKVNNCSSHCRWDCFQFFLSFSLYFCKLIISCKTISWRWPRKGQRFFRSDFNLTNSYIFSINWNKKSEDLINFFEIKLNTWAIWILNLPFDHHLLFQWVLPLHLKLVEYLKGVMRM